MRKNDLVSLALLLMPVLCLGVSGCAVEDVPTNPTFEADILPITISRCVRCHGGGGTLNADPAHTGVFPGLAPVQGYFDRLDDDCGDAGAQVDGGAPPVCKYGLLHYTTGSALMLLENYIHSKSDSSRMPPPPSPALNTRQIEVFDRWLAESPPM